jgi:hypothetical protein
VARPFSATHALNSAGDDNLVATLRTTTLAFDDMVCDRNARRVNVFDEVLREAAASGALS